MAPLKHSIKYDLQAGNKSTVSIPLRAWVSFNSDRFPLNTGIRVAKRFWNKKKKALIASVEFADYNETENSIKNVTKWVEANFEHLTKGGSYPAKDQFKEFCEYSVLNKGEIKGQKVEKVKDESVFKYMDDLIQRTIDGIRRKPKTGDRYAAETPKHYKSAKGVVLSFVQFTGSTDLKFDEVTLAWYYDFRNWAFEIAGLTDNYFGTVIKFLKTSMAEAKEEKLHTNTEYLNRRFSKTDAEVDNIYLDEAQLKILSDFKFDTDRLTKARDIFLVGCWTGLRFSDFTNIKPKDIHLNTIEIKTQKTGGRVAIPIHPELRKVMDRYDGITSNGLPPSISNVKLNAYIKEAAELAGLTQLVQLEKSKAGKKYFVNEPIYKLVATHTARRSFATNMFKMGVPTFIIMAITGHKTEKSFFKYIKVTPKEKAEIMREIWNRQSMKIIAG